MQIDDTVMKLTKYNTLHEKRNMYPHWSENQGTKIPPKRKDDFIWPCHTIGVQKD